MLSKRGVLSAKLMCVENNDLKNQLISPVYGSFENFPHTITFLAEHDITYPDQKIMVQNLTKNNVKIDQIIGEEMPHIWPLMPLLNESKIALKQIIDIINQ